MPVGTTMRYVVRLINYTIAFQFKSVECERLGRTMNLTKSKDRISLGDKTFSISALQRMRCHPLRLLTTPASLLLGMPMGTIQQFHDVAVTRRAKFWLVWRLRLPAETIHQLERCVDFDFFC